jgi:hypothetical protein
MSERNQKVISAVGKHFKTTVEQDANSDGAYLTIADKRIGIDVVTLDYRESHDPGISSPRLRFDRVVIGLLERLQAALKDIVPSGWTIVLTVTAPIRLPAKTAGALEERVRTLLRDRAAGRELMETVHGNQIRIRCLQGGKAFTSRLLVFVHNGDSDPTPLFELTDLLLRRIKRAGIAHAGFSGPRWLVIAIENKASWIGICRHVCSQLFAPKNFQRILLVDADGTVSDL